MAKTSPWITDADLQNVVVFWSHQVSISTIRRHLNANKLFKKKICQKKGFSFI